MYCPYNNDIQKIRTLHSHSPIAHKIYATLLSKDSSDCVPTGNQIKERLYNILYTIPYIPQDFFDKYYDHLFYEIIFEIYHYADVELLQTRKNLTIKESINRLSILKDFKISEEEKISKNKKKLSNDFTNLKPFIAQKRKLNNFYCHMGLYNSPKITPVTTPENTVMILRSYSDSIYNGKNFRDGILLHTVYNIITDYLYHLSDQNISKFTKEYCFYEFNYIYNFIQYINCCSTYLNNSSKIETEYFPLHIYSKLFDTPYISLIDFICTKYKENLKNIYRESSILHDIFIEKELLNTFWIPIINLCLKEIMFCNNGGDFKAICETCKDWLVTQKNIFTSQMYNAKETIESCTYPNPRACKNRKDIKEEKYAKTGSPNHLFNTVLSKTFYYNEFSDYLSLYPSTTLTLDGCFAFIENDYNLRFRYNWNHTLKSCTEYISTNHEAGIIVP